MVVTPVEILGEAEVSVNRLVLGSRLVFALLVLYKRRYGSPCLLIPRHKVVRKVLYGSSIISCNVPTTYVAAQQRIRIDHLFNWLLSQDRRYLRGFPGPAMAMTYRQTARNVATTL